MEYQPILFTVKQSAKVSLDEIENLIGLKDNLREKHFDISIALDEKKATIGIKEVSQLLAWNSLSSDTLKLCFVHDADKLTVEAQSSILKVLEEPNINNLVILIVTSQESLLPTVVSRCKIICHQGKEEGADDKDEKNIEFVKLNLIESIKSLNDMDKSSRQRELLNQKLDLITAELRRNTSAYEKDVKEDMIEFISSIKLGIKNKVSYKILADNLAILVEDNFD